MHDAVAAEYPDTHAEVHPRAVEEQPGNRHPAWIERRRFAINEPGVEEVQDRFLSIIARTGRNCTRDFTLLEDEAIRSY
jgi:hypothetical protein